MKKIISVILVISVMLCAFSVFASADTVIYGDTDGDGKVNSADALKVLQYATGIITLDENALKAANVSADDKINSADALMILQFTTGLIASFPAQDSDIPDEPYEPENPVPSSKEEILDLYKQVAEANKGISTYQTFDLKYLSVGVFIGKIIEPIARSTMEKNSEYIEGFPGDMNALCADDIASASFKDNGDGTYTVNFAVKDQTDTLSSGSKYEGTVGHAIGVVGNVAEALSDVVTIKNADKSDSSLDYKNAAISVTFDKDTLVLKEGTNTWSYTTTATLNKLETNLGTITGSGIIDYKLAY